MRSPSLMQLDALPAILSHKLEHVVSEDEISGIDAVGRLTSYSSIQIAANCILERDFQFRTHLGKRI